MTVRSQSAIQPFSGNSSGSYAGVLYVEQGQSVNGITQLTVTDSIFETSSATNAGGAIFVKDRVDVEILNTTFDSNQGAIGGAVFMTSIDGTANIDNCTFTNNTTDLSNGGEGGALAVLGGLSTSASNVLINQSTFTGNTAKTYGGAVSVGSNFVLSNHGNLTVTDSIFSDNTALSSQTGLGGAIYHKSDSGYALDVTRSQLFDNLAELSGGAIYAINLGNADISLSQFHNNSVGGLSNVYDRYGGALMIREVSDVLLSNSWLCGNETQNTNGNNSGYGGGLYAQMCRFGDYKHILHQQYKL